MRAGAAPRSLAPPPSESRPICRETRTCSLSTSRPCGRARCQRSSDSSSHISPYLPLARIDAEHTEVVVLPAGAREGYTHSVHSAVLCGLCRSSVPHLVHAVLRERGAHGTRPPTCAYTPPALMLATLQVGHGPWPLRLWPFRYGRAAPHIPPPTPHTRTHTHTPQQPPPHPPLTPPPLSPLCPGGGCVCV